MLDPQRIVDDLRSLVQGSDQTLNDRVRQLATDYEAVCREANDRLRRCEDFLQKGLRSEAIHLADAEPALLEIVGVLDFPERPQWEEMAATYGLASAPRMLLPTAEALNKAYTEEHPLESLLQRHRRLALARGPLRDRLGVLRQLALADPASPVWKEDVRTFEKARLEQIRNEMNQANAQRDGIALLNLSQELQGAVWEDGGAETLLQQIAEGAEAGKRQQAWNQLQQRTADLEAAFSCRDAQGAAVLRDQWQALIQEYPLVSSDLHFQRVVPIFRWLDLLQRQQDTEMAFRFAYAKLEQALAESSSAETLETLYHELKRFKRPIPAALTQRYQDRIERLNVGDSRREKYILAATFLAGALALLGLFIFLVTRHH